MSANVLMEFMKDATTLLTLPTPFVTLTKTNPESIPRQHKKLQNVLGVKRQVGNNMFFLFVKMK